jgi:predicted glycosyltransferase involved in capsule biosynthesis
MDMKNCTVIIPHRSKDKDRNDNLFTILEWIDELDFVDRVLIIESDIQKRIESDINSLKDEYTNYKLEYHFLFTKKPFNRSCICNYGATLSKSQNYFFLDNDIFVDSKKLNDIYKRKDYKKIIKPYNLYKALSQEKSKEIRETLNFSENNISDNETTLTISRITAGGMLIINSEFFWDIKGWNESFVGWGYEDNEMKDRIETGTKFEAEEITVYHLYHKQEVLTRENLNPYIYQQCVKDGPYKYIKNTNINSIGKKI